MVRPAARRPATVRRGDGAARQAGDGAAGGAVIEDGSSTLTRMGVGRLNEAISDGDSVFAWKKSAMGHCCFISL